MSETSALERTTLVPRPGEWGAPVVGPDGRIFHKVPNHYERVYWWFDEDWKPARDPFAAPVRYDPHKLADDADTIAQCYFIGGDEGPVKIGYSVDVRSRLRTLQLASPVRLSVLAVASGGMERETAYHWQFAAYRLHGEWFERVPEIEEEIAKLRAPTLSGIGRE